MIKIDNLSITYQEEVVLKNFCLSLPAVGFYTLSGPSGCGKSTILKLLSGRFKLSAKFDGEISINKEKVITSLHEAGKICAYMEQETLFISEMSVIENIIINSSSTDYNVNSIAKRLQIDHLLKNKIHTLSAGEKARVALARTIITDAPILLLDEPFACLNQELAEKVREYLLEISINKLVLISSHVQIAGNVISVSNDNTVLSGAIKYKHSLAIKKRNALHVITKRQLLSNLKVILSLSFFNTIALVLMLLGVILTQSSGGKILSGMEEDQYKFAYLTSQKELNQQERTEMQTIFFKEDSVPTIKLNQNVTFYNQNNFWPIVPYLFSSRALNIQCSSFCVVLPEEIKDTTLPIVLVDNIIVDVTWEMRSHKYENIILVAEQVNTLAEKFAVLDKEKKGAEILNVYLSAKVLSIDYLQALDAANLYPRLLLKLDRYLYQINSKDKLFAFDYQRFLFPLGDNIFYQGNRLIFHDLLLGPLNLRFTNQERTTLSTSLAQVTKNNKITLNWNEYDDLTQEKRTNSVEIYFETTKEGEERELILPWSKAAPLAKQWCEEAIALYDNKSTYYKDDSWEATSFWEELNNFFSEFSSFLKNTMTAIALFCFFIGFLTITLSGTYLFLQQQKKYNLLYVLGYSKGQVSFLYSSNFLFLALVSFVNASVFLISFIRIPQDGLGGNLTLLVAGEPIVISLFDNLSFTYQNAGDLLLLSIIIPTMAFVINYFIYHRKIYPHK